MVKRYYEVVGDRENVYEAAERWKEHCILRDGSLLFESEAIWTLDNLQALKLRFTDSPIYVKNATFDKRFEMQLQGAPKSVYKLAMEVLFMYYLYPVVESVSYRTKRLKMQDVADWGGVEYDKEHSIFEALEHGIGATGTFYNTSKFEEVSFIIQFVMQLKMMPVEQRRSLLNDPWALKPLIVETKNTIGKNVQIQHIVSHILLPDYFECMASSGHKMKIVKAFQQYIADSTETDWDKNIYAIRQALEQEGKYDEVSFYHTEELYEIWHPTQKDEPVEKVMEPVTSYKPLKEVVITNLGNLVFENESILQSQIQTAIKTGKHIIFTGPPGTGKSKLAAEICRQMGVTNKLVTASSNWTTYDTIGGYKPNERGELYFDAGLFLQSFKDKEGADQNHWLIIDEINRADIDKAFGPLFSVLTGDATELPYKASNGEQIELTHERLVEGASKPHQYVLPTNWRIIGTMNTIDKSSLFEMSYAFMRRFAFIPVSVPKTISKTLVEQYLQAWRIEGYTQVEYLTTLWEIINEYRKIGPAIVHDVAKYTLESEDDFTSAIILYVLPQFEGLADHEIKAFIQQLKLRLQEVIVYDLLCDFVEDFFQIGGLHEA